MRGGISNLNQAFFTGENKALRSVPTSMLMSFGVPNPRSVFSTRNPPPSRTSRRRNDPLERSEALLGGGTAAKRRLSLLFPPSSMPAGASTIFSSTRISAVYLFPFFRTELSSGTIAELQKGDLLRLCIFAFPLLEPGRSMYLEKQEWALIVIYFLKPAVSSFVLCRDDDLGQELSSVPSP